MATAGDDRPAFLRDLADTLHEAVTIFARMPKPLLVLVNGPAAGAGLSLRRLGDIVIAARSAHFTAAYTGIGLTPDGGMSWMLPRLIGLRHAQSMILTNRRVPAEEAEEDRPRHPDGRRYGARNNRRRDRRATRCGADRRDRGRPGAPAQCGDRHLCETSSSMKPPPSRWRAAMLNRRKAVAAFLARRKPTSGSLTMADAYIVDAVRTRRRPPQRYAWQAFTPPTWPPPCSTR